MPATALGNVFVALLAHYWLHEDDLVDALDGDRDDHVGVAFVAHGPVNTTSPVNAERQWRRVNWTRKRRGDDVR